MYLLNLPLAETKSSSKLKSGGGGVAKRSSKEPQ